MRKLLFPALALFAAAAALPARAQAGLWDIDAGHSGINFRIGHFVGKTPGKFNKFKGVIGYDAAKPEASTVEVTIETASIDTGNGDRDAHLRTPDFFDVEKFPVITFKSTAVRVVDATHLEVTGDFTMRGITQPVVLKVELGGTAQVRGKTVAGFSATARIDRTAFGVGNSNMLGKDVDIQIDLEAYLQAPPPPPPPASAPASAPAKKKRK